MILNNLMMDTCSTEFQGTIVSTVKFLMSNKSK